MNKAFAACLLLAVFGIAQPYEYEEELLYDAFPKDFAWGVATSAYQVKITKLLFQSLAITRQILFQD